MAKISEAQKRAYKKYRKKNLKKFREYATKYRKVKNESKITKYIDYIDLIKKYAKTMNYSEIATELQKRTPDKTFHRSSLRLFCIANNIKCQIKKVKKREPKPTLTPEERMAAQKEKLKACYKKNKEKILAKKKKKYKQISMIKQAVKAKITAKKDQDLIDKIKAIAENKCIKAEDVTNLDIPSKTIESICKKIGYFYIKPDTEPARLKPVEKKIKVKKQSKLLVNIDKIKIEAEKSTIPEMAKIFEVHPVTLSEFCKKHKIKAVKTVRSNHMLAQERQKRILEMLTNGYYVEDIMDKFNITHKQYSSLIYRVARNNNILDAIKFLDKNEFIKAKKEQYRSCFNKDKHIVNNTLEFSQDNTKLFIRNTRMSFR